MCSPPCVKGGKPCIRGIRITVGTMTRLLAAGARKWASNGRSSIRSGSGSGRGVSVSGSCSETSASKMSVFFTPRP
ncbi:MAG: DUF433 domain-containing protein [Chromatiaceae bacterium]|nr:DUF433 domain-containing protein [Chromatiaceae bacterium]MCF8015795.1 DUF433 domain-containing protein [Chromatiaceae bacterium]